MTNEILIPQTFDVPADNRALAYKIHTVDSAMKTLKKFQDDLKAEAINRCKAGEKIEGLIVRDDDVTRELTDLPGLMSETCELIKKERGDEAETKFLDDFQRFATISKGAFNTLYQIHGPGESLSDRLEDGKRLYEKYCVSKPKAPSVRLGRFSMQGTETLETKIA